MSYLMPRGQSDFAYVATTKWEGDALYRGMTPNNGGGTIFICVGEIQPSILPPGAYAVVIRGTCRHILNTKAAARRQLEAYL